MVIAVFSSTIQLMAGFKDLQVWQRSMELVLSVYNICKELPSEEKFALCSQMQRAAISVPSNIAEGYRRNNRQEYKQFCGIALGSAAELETQLLAVQQIYKALSCTKTLVLCEQVEKMLYALIKKL
jgi:four helix bundle protein